MSILLDILLGLTLNLVNIALIIFFKDFFIFEEIAYPE